MHVAALAVAVLLTGADPNLPSDFETHEAPQPYVEPMDPAETPRAPVQSLDDKQLLLQEVAALRAEIAERDAMIASMDRFAQDCQQSLIDCEEAHYDRGDDCNSGRSSCGRRNCSSCNRGSGCRSGCRGSSRGCGCNSGRRCGSYGGPYGAFDPLYEYVEGSVPQVTLRREKNGTDVLRVHYPTDVPHVIGPGTVLLRRERAPWLSTDERAASALRLAKAVLDADKDEKARARLEKIVTDFPESPEAEEATDILTDLPPVRREAKSYKDFDGNPLAGSHKAAARTRTVSQKLAQE